MPDKMPADLPDRMPEDMPDKMPEDMPDRLPEGMPDRMPQDMPDRMPEDMPDKMPADLPDRMPEDMPDKMPEDMSDRMPEDLPVTKRINVMVRKTRSKVFFLLAEPAFPCLHFRLQDHGFSITIILQHESYRDPSRQSRVCHWQNIPYKDNTVPQLPGRSWTSCLQLFSQSACAWQKWRTVPSDLGIPQFFSHQIWEYPHFQTQVVQYDHRFIERFKRHNIVEFRQLSMICKSKTLQYSLVNGYIYIIYSGHGHSKHIVRLCPFVDL
jgi:hypothetical protein